MFASHKLIVRHISTSGLVDLMIRKVWHFYDENFHQVWRYCSYPFLSYISVGYSWQCVLQTLRMHRITWPMCRGKFVPHMWNPWLRFACSLYNFCGAKMILKDHLQGARPILKQFSGDNFQNLQNLAPRRRFFGKKGVKLNVDIVTTKRHPTSRVSRVFWGNYVGRAIKYFP